MNVESEILIGLSVDELEALAESLLAPVEQARLDDLLASKKTRQLTIDESKELDQILKKVDQLTILKTRARLTLQKSG